jgi:hypothetical protein
MLNDRGQVDEVGSRTRRRPMGRDYAAAKDAEVGKKERRQRVEFGILQLRILECGLRPIGAYAPEGLRILLNYVRL